MGRYLSREWDNIHEKFGWIVRNTATEHDGTFLGWDREEAVGCLQDINSQRAATGLPQFE